MDIRNLIGEAKQSTLYALTEQNTYLQEFAQVIYLCPTNLCNRRCITCGYHKMRKGKDEHGNNQRGLMEWEVFTKTVNDLPIEGRRVYLQKTGEPMMHPKIIDMMQYIKEHRPAYEIAMHTNCGHMREWHIEGLLNYADFLSFSIFGFTEENYKLAHKTNDYNHYLDILDKFHAQYELSTRKPKVYFDVVRCEANNMMSDEEIFNFLSSRYPAFNIGIHFPYNFQNTVKGTEMTVAGIMPDEFYPSCFMPFTMLNILWDGKIGYCVGDPYERSFLGDVRTNSLQEIWNNNEFQSFRRAHLTGNWTYLREKNILCGDCNWLFALKTQSSDNICISGKKNYPAPLDNFKNGMALTDVENIQAGLMFYLSGDVASAMKHFGLAEVISRDENNINIAKEWFANAKKTLNMRKNINEWEKGLQSIGKSLRDVHVSSYHVANTAVSANHATVTQNSGSITTKKTNI